MNSGTFHFTFDHADAGDRLVVRCHQVSNGSGAVLQLELCSRDGRKHYTARANMVTRRSEAPTATADLDLDAWGERPIYGDVLFHGPDFQVIDAMDGVSDLGISGKLRGVRALNWPREHWRTDSAAFDGGLQLALLWSQRVLGGASLPTSIGEVHTWTDEPPVGNVRAVLRGRETGDKRALSDVQLVDDDGAVVAELRGVETHLLPSGVS